MTQRLHPNDLRALVAGQLLAGQPNYMDAHREAAIRVADAFLGELRKSEPRPSLEELEHHYIANLNALTRCGERAERAEARVDELTAELERLKREQYRAPATLLPAPPSFNTVTVVPPSDEFCSWRVEIPINDGKDTLTITGTKSMVEIVAGVFMDNLRLRGLL